MTTETLLPQDPDTARAPDAPALDAPNAARSRIAERAASLVNGATTVLCLTSVMSTQLGDIGERAGAVAARSADIAVRSRDAAEATAEMRALVDGARETVAALAACAVDIERISATLSRLALETRFVGINAAIEAARAGAAGAGFAVVADKVRELADGAGEASAHIVDRLTRIRTAALSSSDAMHRVGAMIGGVDACASEIAAAAGEQDAGVAGIVASLGHVNESVGEIVRVTEDLTEAGMQIGEDAQAGGVA